MKKNKNERNRFFLPRKFFISLRSTATATNTRWRKWHKHAYICKKNLTIVYSFVQIIKRSYRDVIKNSTNSSNFLKGEKFNFVNFLLFAFLKKMHCNRLWYMICKFFFCEVDKRKDFFYNYCFLNGSNLKVREIYLLIKNKKRRFNFGWQLSHSLFSFHYWSR